MLWQQLKMCNFLNVAGVGLLSILLTKLPTENSTEFELGVSECKAIPMTTGPRRDNFKRFFKYWLPWPLFVNFYYFSTNNLQNKTVDFSGIRTRIVRAQGKYADHLTITTAR